MYKIEDNTKYYLYRRSYGTNIIFYNFEQLILQFQKASMDKDPWYIKHNYNSILENLGNNDYYIFMIGSKSGSTWFNIYDYATNTIYEQTDIEYLIQLENGTLIKDWADNEKKSYIKERVIQVDPLKNIRDSIEASRTMRDLDKEYKDMCKQYDKYYSDQEEYIEKLAEKNRKNKKNQKFNKINGGRLW